MHRLGELALHVVAHLGAQGFDAALGHAEGLAELRVDFRQAARLDLAHDRLESRRLARQVLRRIFVREAQVELALLAGNRAAQRLLEIRQQAPGAEHDREVLALAALEWLAADPSLEVDRDAVTVAAAALDVVPVRALAPQALDHRVDVAVRDRRR